MIGFRILRRARKVDEKVVQQFREIPVANVSDSMYRMSAGGARLRPMHKGGRMAGPAFTVKTRPGDNLMVHKALDLAEPGDVIVVDAGGDLTNALIGEIMSTYAARARDRGHRHRRRDPRRGRDPRQRRFRFTPRASRIAAPTRMGPARSTFRSRSTAW